MLQVVVGYGLMLAVMSYNVYILTAVALGMYQIQTWINRPFGKNINPNCPAFLSVMYWTLITELCHHCL